MPIPSLPKPRPVRWAPIPISIGMALLIGIIGYGISSGKDVSSDMLILKPAEATFEVSLLPDPDRQAILDAEPEKISSLVAADVGDPEQTQPTVGTESSGVVVRRVWESSYYGGRVSPDGQYLSYVNWDKGNLAIRSFRTGEKRVVTDEGHSGKDSQFADESVWSPDSKQLAYLWFKEGYKGEKDLRIVDIDGSKPRILFSCPPKSGFLSPRAWSRDGKHILALFHQKPDKTAEIVLVSVADGSIRVLKSLEQSCWQGMSLSPDGRYVVYAFHSPHPPQSEDSSNHDIGLLATDGSHEITLVDHPANDRYPFWAPDGNRIVFASDRSGSMGVWALAVVDGKPKGSPQLIKQNLNGMKPFGLTQDGSYYYGFIASAVGISDVYVATLDPETGEVVTLPAKAVQSFEGRNSQPAFSPDGKYLAYISQRPRGSGYFRVLVIRSLETGQERVISPNMELTHSPCWSPDGRSIFVCAIGPHLYQIDIETGAATPVVRSNEQGNISALYVLSPDGSKIFFRREGEDARIRVYDLKSEREWKPDFQLACGEGYTRELALSPDGQQLAFVVSCDNEWSLQIAPSSGGDTREVLRLPREAGTVLNVRGLIWTPDGRHLLFIDIPKDEAVELGELWRRLGELWRIPVEGGKPQNLGLTMSPRARLSFHPDGRRIAFTGAGPECGGLWTMENFLPQSTASR